MLLGAAHTLALYKRGPPNVARVIGTGEALLPAYVQTFYISQETRGSRRFNLRAPDLGTRPHDPPEQAARHVGALRTVGVTVLLLATAEREANQSLGVC